MNINIDRITGKVALSPSPFTYSVNLPDDFTLSKVIEVQEGEKQKSNEEGQLLYKINIKENGNYDETAESKTVTKTEEQNVANSYTDEDGVEHIELVPVVVPIEWVDNNPIMVPNIVAKTVLFAESPTEFTAEEILQAKYQHLLDTSTYDYILADMFLNEDDIDLEDENHSANTGVAIMQLLPKGQAKTKSIALESPAGNFELLEFDALGIDVYLSGKKFIDGKLSLTTPVASCTIKFVNTTERPVDIKSYAIAY